MIIFFLKALCAKTALFFKLLTYLLLGWVPVFITALRLAPFVLLLAPLLFVVYLLVLPFSAVVQFFSFASVYSHLRFRKDFLPETTHVYWDEDRPLRSLVLSLIWYAPVVRGHTRACSLFMNPPAGGFFYALPVFLLSFVFRAVTGAPARVFWQVAVACDIWAALSRGGKVSFRGFASELCQAALADASGIVRLYP